MKNILLTMLDGHVVTKLDRWVSSRYLVFLQHKERTIA